ncbi:POLYOL TRANSPORTER 5-LIKE [Salix koriyanagi]|uniref:POLYOL TRANSPORTER 5-LIKE n=1 Tax=Salix koriyanagi TaxID=2511006 RepID=A0A9Q0TS14_9ROSI|nr:POLYOL TRANSPORTER 5-LIKE [Salix koriyanagi]
MAGGQSTEGDANPSQPAPDRTLADFGPVKKPKRNRYVLACATLASMTSVLLDNGVMSGADIYIQDDLNISDLQVALLVGTLNLYSLVGSAAAGRTSDWIGRRYTMVMAGAFFFVGSILMGFATNYVFLMVGRFVAGVGGGYALMIAPVYTAEVSSRGFLTSFQEVFNDAGILLGYLSNYAFSKFPTKLGWRFMLGIGAIPSVFLALVVLGMPESPRWLGMKGRLDCNDDVVKVQKQSHGKGVWKELLVDPTPFVRHILICGIGIYFFEQASGIEVIVSYSPRIFEEAGITSSNGKLLATVAVGFTKTVFILVATFLLERIGRRPLFLSSVGGMVLSLTTLGFGLTMIDQSDEKLPWAVALSIAMVLAYVSFFSIGMGPITSVYSSEIFPSRLRAQGKIMGVVVNRVTGEVISTTFFMLYGAITMGGSFFVFAGIAAVAWVFFFVFLPETRTSEDMDVLYDSYIE